MSYFLKTTPKYITSGTGGGAVTLPMLTLSASGEVTTPTIATHPVWRSITVTRTPAVAYTVLAPKKSGLQITFAILPSPVLGDGAITIPLFTINGVGSVDTITGDAALTTPASTLVADGSVSAGITGDAALTVPMMALVAFGESITPTVPGAGGEDDWFFRRRRRAG